MRTHVFALCAMSVFFACCVPSFLNAQNDVVTVTSVTGEVTLSIQEGTVVPAGGGERLIEGDSLRTRAMSNAAVEFSDLSAVELDENTAVTVSLVATDPATGATHAQLNLWWGNLRSLMPGDIPDGSSITVETVNAATEISSIDDLNFEGSDTQINYDPVGESTIAVAHKFDLVMTNLLTEESLLVPEGSIGIVQGGTIQTIDLMIFFPEGDDSLMEIIRDQGVKGGTVKSQLDRVAKVLTQLHLQSVTIEGHTDNIGNEADNMKLAQRRIDNVKKYFVENYGLAPEMFHTISYGETNPLATNDTPEGRAKNRRVEIHYTD